MKERKGGIKMIICSDAGHGGYDPGAMGGGFAEKWGALKLDTSFSKDMSRYVKVIRTRTNDTFIPLRERSKIANNNNVKVFVSHHLNSFNTKAEGVEVLYMSNEGKKLAQNILDELWKTGLFRKNRGLKHRTDLSVLKYTKMPAVIIEYGFVDNDAERARIYPNFDKLGIAAAKGVRKYLGISETNNTKPEISKPSNSGHSIISNPRGTVKQMQEWARSKKATELFINLAPTFYSESVKKGIDPLIVYAQSAKETGYMKFGGVLDASFKNPCGLKTKNGGGDYSPSAHKRFNTWEEGIEAQVDHLALYAGQKGFPKFNSPDPRHFPYLLGTAKTVEELGGKWAPSKQYGIDIVKMINDIKSIKVNDTAPEVDDKDQPSNWAKEAWDFVENKGWMSGNPRGELTRQELAMVLFRIYG